MRQISNEEYAMTRKQVADFVKKEIMPIAREVDETNRFPLELFGRMAELGFLGVGFPEEYGGSGGNCSLSCIFVEELSRGSAGITGSVCAHRESIAPVVLRGTEEQKQNYITSTLRGTKLACFALTEPNAGSDMGAFETAAVPKGDSSMGRRGGWPTQCGGFSDSRGTRPLHRPAGPVCRPFPSRRLSGWSCVLPGVASLPGPCS